MKCISDESFASFSWLSSCDGFAHGCKLHVMDEISFAWIKENSRELLEVPSTRMSDRL